MQLTVFLVVSILACPVLVTVPASEITEPISSERGTQSRRNSGRSGRERTRKWSCALGGPQETVQLGQTFVRLQDELHEDQVGHVQQLVAVQHERVVDVGVRVLQDANQLLLLPLAQVVHDVLLQYVQLGIWLHFRHLKSPCIGLKQIGSEIKTVPKSVFLTEDQGFIFYIENYIPYLNLWKITFSLCGRYRH